MGGAAAALGIRFCCRPRFFTMQITRRQALKNLLGGAAVVGTPGALLAAATREPERKIWQVGEKLQRASAADIANYAGGHAGLMPLEGRPGMFRDMSTGKAINIRDFRESDSYSTVVIPAAEPSPQSRVSFALLSAAATAFLALRGEIIMEFPDGGRMTFKGPMADHIGDWHERVGDMTLKDLVERAHADGAELHVGSAPKELPLHLTSYFSGTVKKIG